MKRIIWTIIPFMMSLFSFLACSSAQSNDDVRELKEVEASKILRKIAKGEDIILINSIIKGIIVQIIRFISYKYLIHI